jgi:hypothetical protein
VEGVHFFPVRHHSPRTAHVLRAFLEEVRPELVLVEGPSDANALIDILVDKETTPPVAILGYRTDGIPGSTMWPFATYSPEYAALAWARQAKVEARFIDITIGQSLASHREEEEEEDERSEVADEDDPNERLHAMPLDRLVAERFGYRSFEEFWEASFEAPKYDEASFRKALVAYADLVRESFPRRYDAARDAIMTARIEEAIAAGTKPSRIAVVAGAAHVAAFVCGDVDRSLANALDATVPCAATVIPYSFPRLAEQTGYGAGNRAPQYYQRAFDADCSFRRATLEVLVEFTEHLRVRGFMASLADTIEAYRLACTLADMRGKSEPGLDEVREATIATMCRGDASHVDGFLWPAVVGRKVGKVASRIGKNSLQEEFWREVESRRLPKTDEPEDFTLRLGDALQVETSIFLHRLRVAGIPYAGYQGTQTAGMRAAKPNVETDEAGGLSALSRVRESWQAQWTPSTDVSLVERIVMGDTLRDVVERTLAQKLSEAKTTGQAAAVMLEAVVTGAPETLSAALDACDRFASTDDDLPSLAQACRSLSGLVSFGSSRGSAKVGTDALIALCTKTFDRAVLRVDTACVGNAEAVGPAKQALRQLHEIALAQPAVDKGSWLAAARRLVESYVVNAETSGLACGLLYLAQEVTDDEVAEVVAQRMSNVLEPEAGASFLAGFFEVNALALVKSRPVVRALDAYLVGIDRDVFRDALPMLRRAFGGLGATERRYLLENLLAVRKLGDHARAAAQVIAEKDKEKLKEMSEEISKAMDDLDDLL